MHDVLNEQDGDARITNAADERNDLNDLLRIQASHDFVQQ